MGPGNGMNYGAMLGSLGSLLGGLFGQNPAEAGMPYLNQIGQDAGQYMNPYIGWGQQAMPILKNQYNQLLNDPAKMINNWGSSFQSSPGYKFMTDQAKEAANEAAAAGGYLGTPSAQMQMSRSIMGLADQDYQNYMNRMQGLYQTGLNGYQGMNQMGFNASQNMADTLSNADIAKAQMAYAGAGTNNLNLGNILGGIGSALATFL